MSRFKIWLLLMLATKRSHALDRCFQYEQMPSWMCNSARNIAPHATLSTCSNSVEFPMKDAEYTRTSQFLNSAASACPNGPRSSSRKKPLNFICCTCKRREIFVSSREALVERRTLVMGVESCLSTNHEIFQYSPCG